MKIFFRSSISMCLACIVSACGALPHSASIRQSQSPILVFEGGPTNATIVIDGKTAGHTDGKSTNISIESGTHEVIVEHSNSQIYKKLIFIEDGTQKHIKLEN